MPKIWEGVKGSPVTAVADFNLETRARLDEQIAARAVDFIKRSAAAAKPFFTYVCFTQMHPPLIHHPDFKGKSGGGVYSDTLAELDHRTGQVLDAIDQAGIADNTIVVWNSDNPAGRATSMGGSNGPWRGHFGSGFEGGMRTPAIVRWPGKVKAGTVTDEIFSAVDWFPTLAALAGESTRVPTDRPIDGVDASTFMLGQSATTGRDHVIYYGSDAGGDVGQMANDEDRVPLHRERQRPDHQAAVAVDLRSDRRPQRGMGSDGETAGLHLGDGARRQAPRRASAERGALSPHQAG